MSPILFCKVGGPIMLMSISRRAALLVAALALAACAPVARLDASVAGPGEQDCYYVIRVTPTTARLDIPEGKIKDGRFDFGLQWAEHWLAPDEDGYIVAKVRGGTMLGVHEVVISFSKDFVMGQDYAPTSHTLVFDAPAGKVVYITNISYRSAPSQGAFQQPGLAPTYKTDIEGARAYLKQHYPLLADKVEQGTYSFMPRD